MTDRAPAARRYAARPGAGGASRALRLGVLVQGAALAWLAFRHGTSVDGMLFVSLGTSEATARLVDRSLAVAAAGAALALAWRPLAPAAAALAAAFLAVAVASAFTGGSPYAELAPAAHATRWLAPLALPFLGAAPAARRTGAALVVLRLAVAATFLAHGWEALGHHPRFVDLLLGTARRWSDVVPSEAAARAALTAIGCVDVAVAVVLVASGWPPAALWATIWGLGTAASRAVALGTEFLPETLLRAANGLAPLALWLLLRAASRPPRNRIPEPS